MSTASTSIFKNDLLKNKVCFITGGHSGIGYGISRNFGSLGCKLMLFGRRENVLAEATNKLKKMGIECSYVRGDVRDFSSCENAVKICLEKYGKLDFLVNSAAGNFLSSMEDISPKGFKTVHEIDVLGTFNMSKACIPALKRKGNENGFVKDTTLIINISATFSQGQQPYQMHAASAKAAIDSMTRHMSIEFAPYGIRVCGVRPGAIAQTEGLSRLAQGLGEMAALRNPLKRLGEVDDVANCCVFLASRGASWVTGETILLDGGSVLGQNEGLPRHIYEMARDGAKNRKKSKL